MRSYIIYYSSLLSFKLFSKERNYRKHQKSDKRACEKYLGRGHIRGGHRIGACGVDGNITRGVDRITDHGADDHGDKDGEHHSYALKLTYRIGGCCITQGRAYERTYEDVARDHHEAGYSEEDEVCGLANITGEVHRKESHSHHAGRDIEELYLIHLIRNSGEEEVYNCAEEYSDTEYNAIFNNGEAEISLHIYYHIGHKYLAGDAVYKNNNKTNVECGVCLDHRGLEAVDDVLHAAGAHKVGAVLDDEKTRRTARGDNDTEKKGPNCG